MNSAPSRRDHTRPSKAASAVDEYTPAERRAIDRSIAASEKRYAAGKSYGPFETAEAANASIDANLS